MRRNTLAVCPVYKWQTNNTWGFLVGSDPGSVIRPLCLVLEERSLLSSDAPATAPWSHGGSHDGGLREWRRPGCHGLRDDRGLGHRVTDDADSSYSCCSQRHVSLLGSLIRRRPRSRRRSPGSGSVRRR